MRKLSNKIIILFLSVILLTACGVTQRETSEDVSSAVDDGPNISNFVEPNKPIVTSGNGYLIIKEFVYLSAPDQEATLSIQKDGLFDTELYRFTLQDRAGITINTLSYTNPSDQLAFWAHCFKQSGGESGSAIFGGIVAPTTTTNVIIDKLVIPFHAYWQNGYYYDISEGIITSNADIDWDVHLVSFYYGTGYYLEVEVPTDNPDSGVILHKQSQYSDIDMFSYNVADALLTKNAAIADPGHDSPQIVIKTREGNYAWLDYFGGSRTNDIYYCKVAAYYYNDGRGKFYNPLEKIIVN